MPPGTDAILMPWTNGEEITWAMSRSADGVRQYLSKLLPKKYPGTQTFARKIPEGAPVFMYDETGSIPASMDRKVAAIAHRVRASSDRQLIGIT